MRPSRALGIVGLALLAASSVAAQAPLHIVFTSDAHFGVKRGHFRGADSVPASVVNRALVAVVNALPSQTLPKDGGIGAGERIGAIDALIEGGDIANRAERGFQSAATSWAEFQEIYLRGVSTRTRSGRATPIWMVPGNHDATNAVGFYRPLTPKKDPVVMLAERAMMMPEAPKRDAATYDYTRDRVHYTRDLAGVHLVFLQIWPDSAERVWLDRELRRVRRGVPVLIFVHDQPDVDAKHMRNPYGAGDINAHDRFENLVTERIHGRDSVPNTVIEQRALEQFLRGHPQVKGYFHGNSNWHEFYDWRGPDGTISLPTFRADSPMKGDKSASDERLLSFMLVSITADGRMLTAREYRWNLGVGVQPWGEVRTIRLR